jgi:hypothetical protein
MPKHNIYPLAGRFLAVPPAEGEPLPPSGRLELHWQRDTYVQLASTRWAGDPAKIDTTQEFLPPESDTGSEPMRPAWEGFFVDLDRGGINHLIKQLRAARDQAYGKDE